MKNDLKNMLDSAVERINRPEFIADDPVQFPRRFTRQEDIEITSLLGSMIAWGNRKMILRDIDRLLQRMDNSPYDYIRSGSYECFPEDENIHRTFFGKQFRYMARGLHEVYKRWNTLEEFAMKAGAAESEAPAWSFTHALQGILLDANNGKTVERCLPSNLDNTALKRINMAFRWLVRDDGIVDPGIWNGIPKSKLFIPLDVHVGNTARKLGLLTRKSNDRKAVVELTRTLKEYCPDDPVKYDFALFGLGIEGADI